MNECEWYSTPTNYVVAGGDCFVNLMSNFIDRYGGDEFFGDSQIQQFLQHNVNRFLYSFGTGLSYKTQKMGKSHTKRIARELTKMTNRPMMQDSKVYLDSGGFQVAMGAIKTEDMPAFVDTYHNFLEDNPNVYDYAFFLDLPPGPNSSVFSSYEQMERLNRLSYQRTQELPEHIRKKMIYIHHFRTPSLYNTWGKFLWDEHYADQFDYFGTGGIVASLSSDMLIPAIIYSLPLSDIVTYAKSRSLEAFKFHILGASNFIDVFYHQLFTYHIKKVHGIDIQITYDSSAIFKALTVGRFIPTFRDDNVLIKMDLRSDYLHLRFDKDHSAESKAYELINRICDKYSMKQITPESMPFYNTERGTLSRCVHMYLLLANLRNFKQLEFISKKVVEEAYPYYEESQAASDVNERQRLEARFNNMCFELSRKLNQGKNTKKQKAKIFNITKSFKILEELDAEYNEHLIKKFMSNDDPKTTIHDTLTF